MWRRSRGFPILSKAAFCDITLRPSVPPTVEVEPDGTVELAFSRTPGAISILMSLEEFALVMQRGRELEMLGRLERHEQE